MQSALPARPHAPVFAGPILEIVSSAIAAVVAMLGVGIAYIVVPTAARPSSKRWFVARRALRCNISGTPTGASTGCTIGPWYGHFSGLPGSTRADFIDRFYSGLALLSRAAYRQLSHSQTGRVRRYAAGITAGSILLVAILVFA